MRELTVRRVETTESIGNALVAKGNGTGHHTIAAGLDRPASTVSRWLHADTPGCAPGKSGQQIPIDGHDG